MRSECLPHTEDEILDRNITIEEIKVALDSLKDRKTSGEDGIALEFLKYGPNKLLELVCDLFNMAFNRESGCFNNKSIIIPLHKKGDRSLPSNYRGIALINSFERLYARVLYNRLEKWFNNGDILGEKQAGFRRGYSTCDNVFNFTQFVNLAWKQGIKKVYCFFIDFKAAFDGVVRSSLFYKLKLLCLSSKFLNGIEILYKNTTNSVIVSNEFSKWFDSTCGMKQGCVLSTLLFAIFLNHLDNFIGGVIDIIGLNSNMLFSLPIVRYSYRA